MFAFVTDRMSTVSMPYAGGDHNLDLNLGISPPASNSPKEIDSLGHLQFHSGSHDHHNGRRSMVRFLFKYFNFWVLLCCFLSQISMLV